MQHLSSIKQKLLLALCLLASLTISTSAQNGLQQSSYSLPFSVAYLNNWAKNYPTILIPSYGEHFMTYAEGSYKLQPLDIIYSVNGEPTEGTSIFDFYNMCKKSDTLNLRVVTPFVNGNHYFVDCTIYQRNNRIVSGVTHMINLIARSFDREYPEEIRTFVSPNVDFVSYKSYDYIITGDDPLLDETIMQEFISSSSILSNMTRDEENPDIVFTIAKNAEESLNSTYVPPTSQVVTTGSTTTPVYNYLTHKHSWITKNRTQVHTTDGYTQMTRTSDIYLEISAIDVKKMAEEGRTTPPIVWQMKYNEGIANRTEQLSDIYKNIARHGAYPFKKPIFIEYFPILVGARFDENNYVVELVPNSNAAKMLQIGDKILKVDGKDKFVVKHKSHSKRFGWLEGEKGSTESEFKLKDRNVINAAIDQYGISVMGLFSRVTLSDSFDDWVITTNFSGERTFQILRNGKKIKVKGELFPFPDIYWSQPVTFKTMRFVGILNPNKF